MGNSGDNDANDQAVPISDGTRPVAEPAKGAPDETVAIELPIEPGDPNGQTV